MAHSIDIQAHQFSNVASKDVMFHEALEVVHDHITTAKIFYNRIIIVRLLDNFISEHRFSSVGNLESPGYFPRVTGAFFVECSFVHSNDSLAFEIIVWAVDQLFQNINNDSVWDVRY